MLQLINTAYLFSYKSAKFCHWNEKTFISSFAAAAATTLQGKMKWSLENIVVKIILKSSKVSRKHLNITEKKFNFTNEEELINKND